MNYKYPDWISIYVDLGFQNDWADDLFEKYDKQLINQLSHSISPINLYDIDLINLENSDSIIKKINVPQDYTISEVLLLILDLLRQFRMQIPDTDSEIYDLYKRIENSKLKNESSFDEFYVFIKRINYTVISETPAYKLLSSVIEEHILRKPPIIDSKWMIKYDKENKIEIRVIDTENILSRDIIDPNINCEVLNIIDNQTLDDISRGDEIQIKPQEFNTGNIILSDTN